MSSGKLSEKKEEIDALVKLAQDGDQDAFAKLYDIFVDPIYRYIFYRVKSDDAEDLVETVFLKVWEHLKQYNNQKNASFSAWVFRIAHNLIVDYYRASKSGPEELTPQIADESRQHNPVQNTQNVLNKEVLKVAIAKLKKQHQDLVIYKFINELDNKEISELLGKSEGALRILQFRALKALKFELQKMGVDY